MDTFQHSEYIFLKIHFSLLTDTLLHSIPDQISEFSKMFYFLLSSKNVDRVHSVMVNSY